MAQFFGVAWLNFLALRPLAPTAFMEMWPAMVVGMPALQGRPITLVGEGRRRHSFVSNRDVAVFAVSAVDRPEAPFRHLE